MISYVVGNATFCLVGGTYVIVDGTLCSSRWNLITGGTLWYGGWYFTFWCMVPYVMIYGTSISFISNLFTKQ